MFNTIYMRKESINYKYILLILELFFNEKDDFFFFFQFQYKNIYKIQRSYYKWNIKSYNNTYTNKYLLILKLTWVMV